MDSAFGFLCSHLFKNASPVASRGLVSSYPSPSHQCMNSTCFSDYGQMKNCFHFFTTNCPIFYRKSIIFATKLTFKSHYLIIN